MPTAVTFIITDLDRGGAENALVQLVVRLDRQLWTPRVICLAKPGVLVDKLRAAEVSVDCLNAKSGFDFVATFFRLRKLLKQQAPAIVCTYLYHANILGRLAAWGLKPRIRVFSGIRVAERRSRWRLWFEQKTEFLVEGHFCVSQAVADFSHEVGRLSREKLQVLPNGIDVELFDKAVAIDWSSIGLPEKSRVLLYVGRLEFQKGVFDLFEALFPLLEADKTLVLVLAGEGTLRNELEARIESADLVKQVILLGQREDIPALMKGADLFVLASHWEGAPNVLLEAMAAQLPLVSTDVEGVRELLLDGKLGSIVPVSSPDEFKAVVQATIDKPKLAGEKSGKAYLHAKKEVTWQRTVRIWQNGLSEQ